MKKFLFLFAMVLATSVVFGQVATIDQTNTAPVGSSVVATVTQTGASEVDVDQITNQDNLGVNSISATITQSGAGGNMVTVDQSALGQALGASSLEITTSQDGINNVALQTQISGSWSAGSQIFMANQVGEKNELTQYSNSGGQEFTSSQSGYFNIGYQQAENGAGGGNFAFLTQNGIENQSMQSFSGINARDAIVEQIGDYNEASQSFLGGSFVPVADRSRAEIYQWGSNDKATQMQDGIGSFQYAEQDGTGDNVIDQKSYGNYNKSYALQYGGSGDIKITQTSTALEGEYDLGNSTMVSQEGNGSVAEISQMGSQNSVEGLGGVGTYAINNNGAQLFVKQDGALNVVQSFQNSATAIETVNQSGTACVAIVSQQ
ncbi:hypothetical protein [uncultured Draconibacterium sp.]|uniref:hypothetical protein n=1 Tax=uncultured Draconibacterium sp. TaxID=1573823 RepID=UPI003261BF51